MGGSTSPGITSGLSRQGYKAAGPVDFGEVDVIAEQMRNRYGPVPKQGYNVYDFLTEWGLNMASSPPMGNVIQTAAGTARGPHAKMVEGKGKDEMAQYMANMSSTDKALSAFTDIKVAQTKAEADRELKNLPFKRQALENAHKIQATKRQGEFGYNIQEALGISTGNLFIAEMMDEKDGAVNAGQINRTYTDDGTSLAPIDFGAYDMDKIWWDPKKLQWLTIQIQEKDGVKTPEGIYHGSKEQAFAALGSTVKTDKAKKIKEEKVPVPDDKKQIEGAQGVVVTIAEGDWNNGKTLSGNIIKDGKVYDKDSFKLIATNSLNYLGNNKFGFFGYEKENMDKGTPELGGLEEINLDPVEDTNIYLPEKDRPSKIIKDEKEKDYSDLDKWWKNQTSNYGSGYQGVN